MKQRIPVALTYDEYKRLARKILIGTAIIVGSAITLAVIAIYINRRDWLYDEKYQPIFDWLPSHGPFIDPETGEHRPRNINSIWK